jgi:hypothetical protein
MSDPIEEHDHAAHAAHAGRRHSALLIAVLAAGLAFSEQASQHATTALSANAIAATDLWDQYQAKSIRAAQARGFADLAAVAAPPGQARDQLAAKFRDEASHYEQDPATGKAAIAAAAKAHEAARDAAHERLQAYENASAALQLGIVLTTASVITDAAFLVWLAAGLGALGAVFGVLGLGL